MMPDSRGWSCVGLLVGRRSPHSPPTSTHTWNYPHKPGPAPCTPPHFPALRLRTAILDPRAQAAGWRRWAVACCTRHGVEHAARGGAHRDWPPGRRGHASRVRGRPREPDSSLLRSRSCPAWAWAGRVLVGGEEGAGQGGAGVGGGAPAQEGRMLDLRSAGPRLRG